MHLATWEPDSADVSKYLQEAEGEGGVGEGVDWGGGWEGRPGRVAQLPTTYRSAPR